MYMFVCLFVSFFLSLIIYHYSVYYFFNTIKTVLNKSIDIHEQLKKKSKINIKKNDKL